MAGAMSCCHLLFVSFTLSIALLAPKHSVIAFGNEVKICFIVRTYWAHGEGGDESLKLLLQSLQRSPHRNWEAVLVVMDSKPFVDLSALVLGLSDDRIWVFADIVDSKFAAKNSNGDWHPEYHLRLYELTDEAIRRGCPPDTQWVVATNGDNEYGVDFMSEIIKADSLGAELVAFDYYSRYQRPTATPCERFVKENGPCKENLLQFCQTDLAANAMRRRKLVKGNYRFAKSGRRGNGASSDGFLMERLKRDGWIVHRITNRCLVAHNPSPQTCVREGMIWDDRLAATQEQSGGTCITSAQAGHILLQHPETEEVTVELSVDEHFRAQFDAKNIGSGILNCLRWSDRSRDVEFLRFFGSECATSSENYLREGIVTDGAIRRNQAPAIEALGRQTEHSEL